tara:strand:+ start:508 stop:837 length:330 start_codon:yes stop_codon:yes gene_type:complete
MYELHSRHTNPEPESIVGSLESRGVRDDNKDIFVTSYHPSWLPVSIGMVLHHYQVKCTFKSLDWHVRSCHEMPEYAIPVGYAVDFFDYDSLDYRHVEPKISKVTDDCPF